MQPGLLECTHCVWIVRQKTCSYELHQNHAGEGGWFIPATPFLNVSLSEGNVHFNGALVLVVLGKRLVRLCVGEVDILEGPNTRFSVLQPIVHVWASFNKTEQYNVLF